MGLKVRISTLHKMAFYVKCLNRYKKVFEKGVNTVLYSLVFCTGICQRNQRPYFRWHTGRWQSVGCPENQKVQFIPT